MRTRLFSAVVLFWALATPSAQEPAPAVQRPTFRGDVNYVRVDMYATQRGVPVTDLTAADVELLEDGAPQSISAFEHVLIRGGGPETSRVEPNTVAESRQLAARPRARVFVIFLDTYNTQIEGSAQMRVPLVRFIDRLLAPDDLVAVMTPEMSAADVTFGRKTTIISNIMQREWSWGRRGRLTDKDPKEELYETCYPNVGDKAGVAAEMLARRREIVTYDALEDLVAHLDGLREERKAVITITEGWLQSGPSQRLARVVDSTGTPPLPDPFGINTRGRNAAQGMGVGAMTECEADRNALAFADNRNRLRQITERANRGNVTFYPVYARGLQPFDAPMGPEPPPSLAQDRTNLLGRQDSLRQMAIETDGLAVIGSNDIDRGMQRILDDTSSYYLLGYYSTNTRLDGRFRNITVRVKRPGVQVRARRGYRGPTAAELTGGNPSVAGITAPPAMSAAAVNAFSTVAGNSPRSQFRLRTATWAHAMADAVRGDVWLVGELDYALRRDVAWTAGAIADVTLVSATGTQLLSTSVDVDASVGRFTMHLPQPRLASGEYALRVRLRSKQEGPVPVSDTARIIVPGEAAAMGDAVLWRRGPSTGPRFAMTADPRFTRNERVRLEFATTAAGTPTARLMDRQGKTIPVPVAISERQDESGAFRWMIAEAALAPLGLGSYAIELDLDGTRSVTAFTVVP